jgi:tetratricopeptide (TPR) repeat protein
MYPAIRKSVCLLFVLFSFFLCRSQSPQSDSIVILSDKIIKQIETAPHDSVKLTLLAQLVDMNMEVRTAEVFKWIEEGVALARKNKNAEKEIALRLKQLRALNMQGKFQETISEAKELLPLLDKTGAPIQKAAYLLSIGNANQRIGNYDVAADAFTQAMKLCEKNGIRDIEVRAGMNLGILYQYLGKYDEMLHHLQNTLAKAEQYKLTDDIPMIKFNISNAEAHQNNYGKAITYLLEVLPYYEKQNNRYALGLAYSNLAWCYFKSQQQQLALDYAYKSHAIRTSLKDKAGLATVERNLGKIFLERAQYDSCYKYADAALTKSLELRLVNEVKDNYETLALLYERQGKYEQAVSYLHKFAEWKDTIYKQEKDKALEKELFNARTEATEKMNRELTASKDKARTYKILAWVLALVLVVLTAGAVIFFRKKKKQWAADATHNGHSDTYELKKKENQRLLQELQEARASHEKLEHALHLQKSTDITALREMISSNKLHSDGYWNEFLLLFSKVYPDFFEKMKNGYPGLNQNELRIAALIKLNHGIPDMAKALNITVDSARKARYRLYKKMELSNDQELTDTIIRL